MSRKSKKIFLLVFFLTLAGYLPAQGSWLRWYDQATSINYSRDTAYIFLLIRQSASLQKTDIDSAIALNKKVVAYSRLHGFDEGRVKGLLRLALLSMHYKNDTQLTHSYLAQAFSLMSHLPEAERGQTMVSYYRQKAYLSLMSMRVDSAAYYYNQALHTIEQYKLQHPKLLYSLYFDLSNVYTNNDQPEKTLYYLKKAEPLIADSTDESRIVLYECFVNAYALQKKYKEVEWYCLKGLKLLEKYPSSNYTLATSTFYFRLGEVRAAEQRLAEAIAYLQAALAEDHKRPMLFRAISEYESLAKVLYQAGAYRKAEFYLKKAIGSAKQQQAGRYTLEASYALLSRLYSGPLRNYRLAYYYRDLAASLRDSFQQKKKQEMIHDLEVRYRTLDKDKAIKEHQLLLVQKNKELFQKQLSLTRQKFWVTSTVLSSLLVTVLLAMVYGRSRQRLRLQEKSIKELKQEKEIGSLRSVIAGEERERLRLAKDLHDGIIVLFSAVKMKIGQLARRPKSNNNAADLSDLDALMEQAIKELRLTAHNLMPDMLLEGGLAEAVFYFSRSLQKTTSLDITFQQYGELPRLPKQMELSIYRIIQELLQNILKHAAATKVLLQLNYHEGLLSITVEDNGGGFDTLSVAKREGIGLKSIKLRLQALDGHMDIRSRPTGTTAYLEFETHNILEPKLLRR